MNVISSYQLSTKKKIIIVMINIKEKKKFEFKSPRETMPDIKDIDCIWGYVIPSFLGYIVEFGKTMQVVLILC